MGLSLGHLLILLVVVLLFSARRLPSLGTALGKGLKAFKEGMKSPTAEAGEDQSRGGQSRRDELK